ncbi:ribosomal-protein-alanine N-acetyltransferase [Pseudarthrobacter oxydans]|uniref:Ribosomal-protein-alanine N-acetyltransferase n=1 Tax=Pseudarthrobacter oxydans TaxID=1671 RepID=A0AAW8NEL4_PSEOX|nr:GNAT family N-acetyltransferase [Pseudarthrobacter oxydans]MDR6793801.1 ribosomal-protein-alanine N-acetyltransferase [Pseudarthrobacter oxydans]MDR7165140.1 ribosomal-protein-alanine N-acetyltransferase [Pseudarthrobacter oxydans]
MAGSSAYLREGLLMRLLEDSDAAALARAYQRNRGHLAPWEPKRTDSFFTSGHQADTIRAKLAQHALGTEVPWVLVQEEDDGGGRVRAGQRTGRVVGAVTLTGIVRGPFLSANLGYWVDHEFTGQGIGTAAVLHAASYARTALGLHRIQAATLLHNTASRQILQRAGFREIGVAPDYLKIAGQWQDHLLHQLILPHS